MHLEQELKESTFLVWTCNQLPQFKFSIFSGNVHFSEVQFTSIWVCSQMTYMTLYRYSRW